MVERDLNGAVNKGKDISPCSRSVAAPIYVAGLLIGPSIPSLPNMHHFPPLSLSLYSLEQRLVHDYSDHLNTGEVIPWASPRTNL